MNRENGLALDEANFGAGTLCRETSQSTILLEPEGMACHEANNRANDDLARPRVIPGANSFDRAGSPAGRIVVVRWARRRLRYRWRDDGEARGDPSQLDAIVVSNDEVDGENALWRSAVKQVRRIAIILLGGTVLTIGVLLIVLPGPALLVIPLGLAILAIEFAWAEQWLRKARTLLRTGASSAERKASSECSYFGQGSRTPNH